MQQNARLVGSFVLQTQFHFFSRCTWPWFSKREEEIPGRLEPAIRCRVVVRVAEVLWLFYRVRTTGTSPEDEWRRCARVKITRGCLQRVRRLCHHTPNKKCRELLSLCRNNTKTNLLQIFVDQDSTYTRSSFGLPRNWHPRGHKAMLFFTLEQWKQLF